ncbi:MAG: hypothetical protein KI790_17120 [Cyclobacteriaceae bacterium]|nr:hypothetical protein [Cyclobacteriaceae bacterium HetDA_MAG_MS6]
MSRGGIHTLKEILFEEEKEKYQTLSTQLSALQGQMQTALNGRELPDSELQQIVEKISIIMPDKMGPVITETLKVQIREQKDEVVQTLYPIIGQMIKKFIQREIQVLTEKIDYQLEKAFSWEFLLVRIKAFFTGTSTADLVLKASDPAKIEEIFLIEEGSGLLLASYSRNKTIDQDMIAGMLTAIRAFVEDAFSSSDQKLETISYDLFKIYVQSFGKFYIAVVLSGGMDTAFKNRLDDTILKFVKDISIKADDEDHAQYLKLLNQYFNKL